MSKTKSMFFKVLCVIIGLAMVAFGVYKCIMAFSGKTVDGRVTDVSVHYSFDDDGGEDTVVTTKYEFEVDGVTYTGSGSETAHASQYTAYSEQFIAERQNRTTVTVRYLPSNPKTNDLNVNAKPNFGNIAIIVFLTVLGLAFVVAGIIGKPEAGGKITVFRGSPRI